jgi:pimeloyl-ACP methyl ester carboxylesterase
MIHLYEGHKINYNDSGKGFPVVLLHGYLESSVVWNGFEEKLALKFRVISIDLPGHGRSDIISETQTMEMMAAVVKDLISSLGLRKVFLTGHSLGGYVTLAFLELFPEFFSGYCLFHSHPFADSPEVIKNRHREIKLVQRGMKDRMYPGNVIKMFATSNIEKFSESIQRSKEISSCISGEGIIAVLRGMIARPSRVDYMEKGIVPCLWILGRMDNYIPCEAIIERVNLPLNATLVILENSGHIGFIEEEEISLRLISEYVRYLVN